MVSSWGLPDEAAWCSLNRKRLPLEVPMSLTHSPDMHKSLIARIPFQTGRELARGRFLPGPPPFRVAVFPGTPSERVPQRGHGPAGPLRRDPPGRPSLRVTRLPCFLVAHRLDGNDADRAAIRASRRL